MLLVERVDPDEVALKAALGGHVEVGFDPHGRIPEVDELRSLQEDPVDDDDELGRSADAQHMRVEPFDIERVEVVALG